MRADNSEYLAYRRRRAYNRKWRNGNFVRVDTAIYLLDRCTRFAYARRTKGAPRSRSNCDIRCGM